jgi:putative peptidoglycan lipid II flippase
MVFALALPGHVLNRTLAALFFAHNDTRTPLITMLIGLSVAFGAGVALRASWGHLGIAAALTFATWLQAALLAARAPRGTLALDRQAHRNLPRIAIASLMMAGAVWGAHHLLSGWTASRTGDALILGALITGGLALYAGLLRLAGVVDPATLARAWRADTRA